MGSLFQKPYPQKQNIKEGRSVLVLQGSDQKTQEPAPLNTSV